MLSDRSVDLYRELRRKPGPPRSSCLFAVITDPAGRATHQIRPWPWPPPAPELGGGSADRWPAGAAVLVKRIWCCVHALCPRKSWTERHEAIAPRAVLTERARAGAVEQVARRRGTVAGQAGALGVGWHTIMRQVRQRGLPVVEDSTRLQGVTAIGVDEHAWRRGRGLRHTHYATGIVDLTPGRVAGRPSRGLKGPDRHCGAGPVPGRYASALSAQLPAAVQVLDAFHVCKLGLSALDDVRRRVQQHTTGHRGHKHDPLYRARRLLSRRADRLNQRAWARLCERLDAGDPNGEVTTAWVIAQDIMAIYQAPDADTGRQRADALITHALACPVPQIQRLGRTLRAWRTELLAYFSTDLGYSRRRLRSWFRGVSEQREVPLTWEDTGC